MQSSDKININGRNIDRPNCAISVTGLAGTVLDLTNDVVAIDYTATQEKEFGKNLSLYPSSFAAGSIVVEGTLTLTDGGVKGLNDYAKELGGQNLMDLGLTYNMDILVEYLLNDGSVETDTVHIVHFTTLPRGLDSGTLINSRAISFIAAQLITL